MVKQLYKIRNISKEPKRFMDHHQGEYIILGPQEVVINDCPPNNNCFKVEKFEKKEKDIKPKKVLEKKRINRTEEKI